jgi:RNA polymerase sigma-70 factor (ECF subfamily)
MNEWVAHWPDRVVNRDLELDHDFEERVRDSSRLAFGIAYGVLRNREDAQEIAQEAFARAYLRIAQLRDRESFRAWLSRLTWRLAIDRWRSDRRRMTREQQDVALWRPSVEQTVVARERARHVWLAIDNLPEKLRMTIVLAAIEGHDLREVAALLDIPEGTVKSRLFEARKQLAEALRWLVTDSSTR